MTGRPVADALVAELASLGVRHVFGLPGSQSIALFESLRRSSLRTVVPTHELAAAFMACGYARAAGRPGILVTIPGPGFTYALTGAAEALADGAAMVWISLTADAGDGHAYRLQALPQAAIARPLVKEVVTVTDPAELQSALRRAYVTSGAGWPGPVMVELPPSMLTRACPDIPSEDSPPSPDPDGLDELVARFEAAHRPLLIVGEMALDAGNAVASLAEAARMPVLTTPGARGVMPESHALAMGFDSVRGHVAGANALIAEADLVVALGCRFGHAASAGFGLDLPAERLVDVGPDVDGIRNYRPSLVVTASCRQAAASLAGRGSTAWDADRLARARDTFRTVATAEVPEPDLRGARGPAAAFFAVLQRALPPGAVVVTDSGTHQVLARRHLDVLGPRQLLVPTEFQSMGFGLPAALGAALAADRPVVAVIGDGSLLMTAMELATAVRDRIPVTVAVLSDGAYGLIRSQQLQEYGRTFGVDLAVPDLEGLAAALGTGFVRFDGAAESLSAAIGSGPTLVDVRLGDSWPLRRSAAAGLTRAAARRAGVRGWLRWVRAVLRRSGPHPDGGG